MPNLVVLGVSTTKGTSPQQNIANNKDTQTSQNCGNNHITFHAFMWFDSHVQARKQVAVIVKHAYARRTRVLLDRPLDIQHREM
jgi:hypothetical protein